MSCCTLRYDAVLGQFVVWLVIMSHGQFGLVFGIRFALSERIELSLACDWNACYDPLVITVFVWLVGLVHASLRCMCCVCLVERRSYVRL